MINECPLDLESYVRRTASCVGKESKFFRTSPSNYDAHKGYLLLINQNEYLDCFEARYAVRESDKCFASFANSACGLKDPTSDDFTPINNAEIVFGKKPYLKSIKKINRGEEIFAAYGTAFFR